MLWITTCNKRNNVPTLNIDQFDTEPSVGQKVRVEGEIKSINTDNGEVDVSYDSVKIIKNRKKPDNSNDNSDNTDESDNSNDNAVSLDQALQNNFGYTQ